MTGSIPAGIGGQAVSRICVGGIIRFEVAIQLREKWGGVASFIHEKRQSEVSRGFRRGCDAVTTFVVLGGKIQAQTGLGEIMTATFYANTCSPFEWIHAMVA